MTIVNLPSAKLPQLEQFITVLKWLSHTDYSYVGDVLKVKALDHPFIIVHRLNTHSERFDTIKLDLRRIEWKPLSDEFVDSYVYKPEAV